MALSRGTQDAVRSLWTIGSQHGRAPIPTPEVDPWEDEDPIDEPRDEAVVAFPGDPCVEVHLNGDLEDLVTVEQYIDFETPRHDTLALVEALLAGDARLGPAPSFLRALLQAPFGVVLIVPVRGGGSYTQRVPYQPCQRWLSTLPVGR